MKTRLQSLIAFVVIAALPLSTLAGGDGKVTLCHNGHTITISVNSLQKHLDNHNKADAKLTCFIVVGP